LAQLLGQLGVFLTKGRLINALRAHTKAPWREDFLWKMRRALNRPGGSGQADISVSADIIARIFSIAR
jgi:hypothetical protein